MTWPQSDSQKAGLRRCPWAKDDEYIDYHDREWGVPVHDDHLTPTADGTKYPQAVEPANTVER